MSSSELLLLLLLLLLVVVLLSGSLGVDVIVVVGDAMGAEYVELDGEDGIACTRALRALSMDEKTDEKKDKKRNKGL